MADDRYIHGFSREEQRRLVDQAGVLAPRVFGGLDLSAARSLLELGCGVGAELKLIGQRWPHLRLTGIDISTAHLRAASDHLAPELGSGTAALVQGDALKLPFGQGCFDRVVTIWMLEHVADPVPVLAEAIRVLEPDGWLVCTEVDNGRFGFEPEQPAIARWWECFNRYQSLNGGDPYVGRRLLTAAQAVGCRDIRAEPLHIISSQEEPERRSVLLEYLRELLLSGEANLLRSGLVDQDMKRRLEREFAAVGNDPGVHFHYHGVRLWCRPGISHA